MWSLQPTVLLLGTLQVQSYIVLLPPTTRLFCQVFRRLSYLFIRPVKGKAACFMILCNPLDSWQYHNGLKGYGLASDTEFVWLKTFIQKINVVTTSLLEHSTSYF